MNERIALAFRRAMYNLRGGFLVRPLTIALALGFAGAVLSWMEEEVPGISSWVPKALFPSHADPQVAQVLLGGNRCLHHDGGIHRLRHSAHDVDAGLDAIFAAHHSELYP